MTDFLTRLADRTVGLTPPIRPLITSPYSTPLPDLAPAESMDVSIRVSSAPRATESLRPGPQSPAQADSRVTGPGPEAPGPAPDATRPAARSPRSRDTDPDPQRLPDQPRHESRPDSRRPELVRPRSADSEHREAPAAAPERDVRRSSSRSSVTPTSEVAILPIRRRELLTDQLEALDPPFADAPPLEMARHDSQPDVGPQTQLEPRGEAIPRRPVTPALKSASLPANPASVAALTDAIESPPVIRVSIGRIEVRAVVSSPPADRPVATPSAPALSLQDYLKQQPGGSR